MQGKIQFNCNWIKGTVEKEKIIELDKWRNKFYSLGLIGINKDGVGVGNISIRDKGNQFIVSGTGTGKKKNLNEEHYCKVTEFDLKKNCLSCKGKTKASSESLTHAALYESNKGINAVIHVHSPELWKFLLKKVPATKEGIESRTKEIAFEMQRLIKEKRTRQKKIILIEADKEGIICFGKDLNQAGNVLLNYWNGMNSSSFPKNLAKFLKAWQLKLIRKIAKGFSSEVFLVKKGKKSFALKIEKVKSRRKEMAEREVENLKKANSVKVGPLLHTFDLEKRIILMEFIKGKTFSTWLFGLKKNKENKKKLKKFIEELFSQAEKMDEIGLDHGQLAGRGVNILVKKGKPVIIDFEKASMNRKCHNKTVLESFLFKNPHSEITKKVKEVLK